MNYIRSYLFSLFVDITHVKALRKEHIDLYGNQGIFLSVDVFNLNVEFRSVESRLAYSFGIIKPDMVQNPLHLAFRISPCFGVVNVFFLVDRIPLGKTVGNVAIQSQRFQHEHCKVKTAAEFLFELRGHTDNMTFAERKLAYPDKAVHFAAGFVSEKS